MLITRPSHVSKETYSVSIGRFLISYSILDISLSVSRNFCLASPSFSASKSHFTYLPCSRRMVYSYVEGATGKSLLHSVIGNMMGYSFHSFFGTIDFVASYKPPLPFRCTAFHPASIACHIVVCLLLIITLFTVIYCLFHQIC